jgi:integrase
MARRPKDAPVDLVNTHDLTVGLIEALKCPEGKAQAFLRDSRAPGLRVRVTSSGAKAFVFEAKVNGKTLRRTLGGVAAWTIGDARAEANKLRVLVDKKLDPRELDRAAAAAEAQAAAQLESQRALDHARSTTVAQAWSRYLAEGKPRGKAAWKPRYRADLERVVAPGGEARKRGGGETQPGHLAPLLPLKLIDLDSDVIRDWFVVQSQRAPVQATRALAMLSGFLTWCGARKEFRALVHRDAARARDLADVLPAKTRRTDALELEQLRPWFEGTNRLRSSVARAYLQALVLTGARREEMAALKWTDIDWRWKKLTVADKVVDRRTIPLTRYLSSLLDSLPRELNSDGTPNPFVFASTTSKSGHIAEPRAPHEDVLSGAGIPHVSIHGLRRTFALLGEAAGAPAGAIAQVMGHRPSAVAEGYKPRSVDALRPYLAKVEHFILTSAGAAMADPGNASADDLVVGTSIATH